MPTISSSASTAPAFQQGFAQLKIQQAKRNAEQAEANKLIAQAQAEVRRAAAVATEQEMVARVSEMRARVVEAEAQIPIAIAAAFQKGHLGIMDYYRIKNVQADTTMRENIGSEGRDPSGSTPPSAGHK